MYVCTKRRTDMLGGDGRLDLQILLRKASCSRCFAFGIRTGQDIARFRCQLGYRLVHVRNNADSVVCSGTSSFLFQIRMHGLCRFSTGTQHPHLLGFRGSCRKPRDALDARRPWAFSSAGSMSVRSTRRLSGRPMTTVLAVSQVARMIHKAVAKRFLRYCLMV